MGIPSQAEYEADEAARFNRQLRDVERASLQDRRESRQAWFEAMRDMPDVVAERIGWLLNGSYGFGAAQWAARVLKSRMNKQAALGQVIAALEWGCPADFARGAWGKLTKEQKDKLQAAIQKEIEETVPAVKV